MHMVSCARFAVVLCLLRAALCEDKVSDGDPEPPHVAQRIQRLTEFLNYHMFGEHALTFDTGANSFKTTSPERKVVCQVVVGQHSADVFEHLVYLLPQFTFVVLDQNFNDPVFGASYFTEIESHAPGRVVHSSSEGYGGVCDILVMSLDVPFFTFQSVIDILRRVEYAAIFFDITGCELRDRKLKDRYACDFLIANWKKTFCGQGPESFQGCEGSLCMCFTMMEAIMDPVYVPINCSGFTDVQEESFHGTSQWHQDWFYYHNFLKFLPPRKDGLYVDVGAYDPFLISSTVAFEQCFGWKGICVEPNPQLVHSLRAYRNCLVYPVCVWNHSIGKSFKMDERGAELAEVISDSEERTPDEYFNPKQAFGNDSTTSFSSTCYSLHDIMTDAGYRGRRIDLLSVDVEHGEVAVFEAFPFQDWDIRLIVVETNRDTAFAVDVLMLTNSFTKVALLGKDAVYAHHSLISEVTRARGFFSVDFPVEMQRYEEPYSVFQRRFLNGDFKGEDDHF